jgi:putative transposase
MVGGFLHMAQKLRVAYEGAMSHVMNRGDHREAIFLDDPVRRRLVETVAEACTKTGWQVGRFMLLFLCPNIFTW